MTPRRTGEMTWMLSGARPVMALAGRPTASTFSSRASMAMTDGSFRTTPSPGMYTRVFAVPRSTARSVGPARGSTAAERRDSLNSPPISRRACADFAVAWDGDQATVVPGPKGPRHRENSTITAWRRRGQAPLPPFPFVVFTRRSTNLYGDGERLSGRDGTRG